MRLISTRSHGLLDYVVGTLLIWTPWFLAFNEGGKAQWVFVLVGHVLIMYSLITNYENSIAGSISMRTHLKLDILTGAFLASSPWLLGFATQIFFPHLIFGICLIGIAFCSERKPFKYPRHVNPSNSNTAQRYHF